ncbi:MAG: Na/Pi cotransporter family protein [Firmicutes bacterium]|nr:Na/Pi cotransporter family protein [Bacillota bacterium]
MAILGYVLLGAGGFFLGLKTLSGALEGLFSQNFRRKLGGAAREHLWQVFLVSIVFAGLVQSSSAVTVIGVCLVNAGVLSLTDAVALTLGANIGTTVTSQLISFPLRRCIPWLFLVGLPVAFWGFATKRKGRRVYLVGLTLLGLGLLFTGFELLQYALGQAARSTEYFRACLRWASTGPGEGFTAGLVGTGVLQSSSLFMASIISLANQGAISFTAAFFAMLGSNIGTSFTTLLAGLGASRAGKAASLANLSFNILSVLLILPFWYLLATWAQGSSSVPGRQLANAHTAFNVITAVAVLPLAPALAGFLGKITNLHTRED